MNMLINYFIIASRAYSQHAGLEVRKEEEGAEKQERRALCLESRSGEGLGTVVVPPSLLKPSGRFRIPPMISWESHRCAR